MTKGVVGFICFGGGIRSYVFVGEGVNNAYIVMCMYEVLGSKWTVELRIRKNLGESDLYNGMTTQLVNITHQYCIGVSLIRPALVGTLIP